jgi:hypothetical protein
MEIRGEQFLTQNYPIALDLNTSLSALTEYERSEGSHEFTPDEAKSLSKTANYLGRASEVLDAQTWHLTTEKPSSPEVERLIRMYLDDDKAPGLVSHALEKAGIPVDRIGTYVSILESMGKGKKPQVEGLEKITLEEIDLVLSLLVDIKELFCIKSNILPRF